MVILKWLACAACLLTFSFLGALQTVQVDVSIDLPNIYEEQPLPVTITVTHDKTAPIDVSSREANKSRINSRCASFSSKSSDDCDLPV